MKATTFFLLAAIVLPCWSCAMRPDCVSVPTAENVLKTLDETHPRLILKDVQLAELKERMAGDVPLKRCVDRMLREADALCGKPPLRYKKIGPRLLSVSRECVRRMYTLGLACRLTGERKYVDKAKEDLLAVCAFDDWNPSHFLDTAEMSHAVGVGYDWFYHAFDDATRAKIREGLIRNGLEPGVAAYRRRTRMWWVDSEHNWNQVCNGGLIIGALAISDTDPQYAQAILPAAVRSLPKALATYAPDGAWGEGPGYWGYATRYTVYCLAALESALGTDFGLGKMKGIDEAGWFPIHMTGPTGLYFNFADAGEGARRRNIPELFWLARRYDEPAFAEAERAMMRKHPGNPFDVIWYVPPPEQAPAPAALDKRFGGPVEVASFRSAWDDPNALFVAVKAGYGRVGHAQLDMGTFVLDAMGVRWARDLGSDDYNLPGYWDRRRPEGKRWAYYRLGSLSHNVPLLDDRNQNIFARTAFVEFKSEPDDVHAILDLTSAYADLAEDVKRGVRVLDRRRVLIQDELVIGGPCEVAWGMTTGAEIQLDGSVAVLTEKGRTLRVEILTPADVVFTVESAEQPPPQKRNAGIRRLMLRLPDQQGHVRIAVLFSPQWPEGKDADAPVLKALSDW